MPGEEEEEGDEEQKEGDLLRVDRATGEVVETVKQRHLQQRLQQHLVDRLLVPGQRPEQHQHAQRAHRCDCLTIGEGREKQAHADEHQTQEQQPGVPGRERRPVHAWIVPGEQQGVEQRQPQHHEQKGSGGQELTQQDAAFGDGVGPQQVQGAELLFLGERTGGEDRHQQQQDEAQIMKEKLPQPFFQVRPAPEHEEAQVSVEEKARERERHRYHGIGEEQAEIRAQLFGQDGKQDHLSSIQESVKGRIQEPEARISNFKNPGVRIQNPVSSILTSGF